MLVKEIVELENDVLFAVHWEGDDDHCLNEMLDKYTDAKWLRVYLKKNAEFLRGNISMDIRVQNLIEGKGEMIDVIYEKGEEESKGYEALTHLFENLGKERLAFIFDPKKNKGISAYRDLRIYAIKNSYDQYFITGFAIKFSYDMDDHPDTKVELKKLSIVDCYLNKQ